MAKIISLPTFTDQRGKLTVIEKILPFKIQRLYFIYDAKFKRGGHRHKTTIQALICLSGKCSIYINDNKNRQIILLDRPDKCLLLDPEDWHTLNDFSKDAVVLVLASEYYDKNDYIEEEYSNDRV